MAALTYGFTRLGPNPLDEAPPAAAAPAFPREAPTPASLPELPKVGSSPAVAMADTTADAAPAEPPAEDDAVRARAPEDSPPTTAPVVREPRESVERTAKLDTATLPATPPLPDPNRQSPLEFPEFTDSSRPPAPYRASDGPRIDSLFERASEAPRARASAAATNAPPADAPPADAPRGPLTSCEAAIARNNEQLTIGAAPGAADITRGAYAAILENGRYLAGCALPERTAVEICAAVRDGRAVGVTVTSNPASAQLNACVRDAVGRLIFPRNSRLDVTRTRFDALRR